jgi:PII-like signaling protein
MEKESEAVLLRIFLGESDMFKGKPLHKYLLDLFKKEGLAGATITRALSGYGKTSRLHTSSVLRLSTDLPLVIEVADKKEKINGGLITEEKIRIIYYEGKKRDPSG